MKTAKQQPIDAYMVKVGEIHTLLDTLKGRADNMFDVSPDDVHHGHVGDLDRVIAQLRIALSIHRVKS